MKLYIYLTQGVDLSKPILELNSDEGAAPSPIAQATPSTGEGTSGSGSGRERARRTLNQIETNTLSSILAVIPSQGFLRPYEKRAIAFRFSPRCYRSGVGYKSLDMDANVPRHDYALFVHLQMVGNPQLMENQGEAAGDPGGNGSGVSDEPTSPGLQKEHANAKSDRKISGVTDLEIAVTATALPVLLTLSKDVPVPAKKEKGEKREKSGESKAEESGTNTKDPKAPPTGTAANPLTLGFEECGLGDMRRQRVTLRNESTLLPLNCVFRPLANFTPGNAHLSMRPLEKRTIDILFTPRQLGAFDALQYIDVLGQVCLDNTSAPADANPSAGEQQRDPLATHTEVIHSVPLRLVASARAVTFTHPPRFNLGVVPQISNEMGLYTNALTFGDKAAAAVAASSPGCGPRTAFPRAAVLRALDMKHAYAQRALENVLIAFPNDRWHSIRPAASDPDCKSIFLRTFILKYYLHVHSTLYSTFY